MNSIRYFDHNATSPLLPEAREAMEHAARETWANPSSLHGPGRKARKVVEEARERIAGLLGCAPHEIIFTSGGTEACHFALLGLTAKCNSPGHLAISAVEHPAVKSAARVLEEKGWALTWMAPDAEGVIHPETVASALRPDTALCAVMAAQNEMGALQPIAEIGALLRGRKVVFFCDAVQALGKTDLKVEDGRVDMASFSAHKIGGPKGVGALFVRKGLSLEPLMRGGGQERDMRGGTENVPAIVGFGAAATWWSTQGARERERLLGLRDALERELLSRIPNLGITALGSPRLPNTLHATFPGCRGDLLTMALDLRGFAVSAGSACASGSVKPSETLLAMGRSPQDAASSLRFSLGLGNAAEGIPALAEVVSDVYREARSA